MHVHTCEDSFMLGFLRETTGMRLDDAVDRLSICILRFYSFLQTFMSVINSQNRVPQPQLPVKLHRMDVQAGLPPLLPSCAKLRTDKEEPMCVRSNTCTAISLCDSRQRLLVSDPVQQGLVAGQTPRIPFCPSDGQSFLG